MTGSTPAARRRPWIWAAALAVLVAAVLATAWPLPASLGRALPGPLDHPGLQGDIFFQWNLWRQMESGTFPDHMGTDYLRVPEGQEFETKVGFSLNLALFALLMVPFDLLTAHNLAVLLILLLNGVAMFAALRTRRGPALLSLGAALAYAIGPYVFLKLDQGFVQKSMIFTVPPFVAFALAWLETFRWRHALGAGAMVVVAATIYPPYAVYHLLFAAALAPLVLAQRGRGRLALALVGAMAAVTALTLLLLPPGGGDPAAMGFRSPAAAGGIGVPDGTLDPFHLFRWQPYHLVPPGAPVEYVRSLVMGLSPLALVLCALGAVMRRGRALPLLLAAAAFAVLMAGPILASGGEAVTLGGRQIPLPLALVRDTPLALVFNYPVRMAPWVVAALLFGAVDGAGWLRDRATARIPNAAAGVPIILALALALEAPLLFPGYRRLHIEPVAVPEYCEIVPEDAAVLHLPYYAPGPHVYEFHCVLCDRPTVNSSLGAPPPLRIPLPDDPEATRRGFLDDLARAGVSHVVVHPRYYGEIARRGGRGEPSLGPSGLTGRDVEHWLSQLCGPPRQFIDDEVHAYAVPDPAVRGD